MSPASIVAAGNVYVSNVSYDPGTFFTGDTGTVAFMVTNGNSNTTVGINHATFGDSNFQLVSGTYDSSSTLGPLQSRKYIFSVVANANDGTYYPAFSLSFRDADNLNYQSMVKIDNTPLILTVQQKPDAFTQGKKDTVTVQIANPRQSDVKNVIFTVRGGNATLTPSDMYIGNLTAGTSQLVNFSVTPDRPTLLEVTADYDNGDNHHSVGMTIPVPFTTDKQQAHPVMSNVAVKNTFGVYHVTGDITNAGLLSANGVTVTSGAPAEPTDPYRNYVIGALKPDDFGSFELSFAAPNGTASVPLQISYKDKDGNVIVSEQPVDLTGAVLTKDTGHSSDILPIVILVIVIALGCGGYYYLRKRKNQ
jgi:CARDB.